MSTEILIEFKRISPVVERGKATLVVDDPEDIDEIQSKMARNNFKSFVITERSYLDVEWEWEATAWPDPVHPIDDDEIA